MQFDWGVFVGRLPVRGDSDGDDDVDLIDFAAFFDCAAPPGSGPAPTPPMTAQDCLDLFDLDGDGDVDLFDFAEVQQAFTGSHTR
jgi:hypothetical protein